MADATRRSKAPRKGCASFAGWPSFWSWPWSSWLAQPSSWLLALLVVETARLHPFVVASWLLRTLPLVRRRRRQRQPVPSAFSSAPFYSACLFACSPIRLYASSTVRQFACSPVLANVPSALVRRSALFVRVRPSWQRRLARIRHNSLGEVSPLARPSSLADALGLSGPTRPGGAGGQPSRWPVGSPEAPRRSASSSKPVKPADPDKNRQEDPATPGPPLT